MLPTVHRLCMMAGHHICQMLCNYVQCLFCGRNHQLNASEGLSPDTAASEELGPSARSCQTLEPQLPLHTTTCSLQSLLSPETGPPASSLEICQEYCCPLAQGNPENPRDGGAWWAAIYGVAQSWTRLKRLSSSSSSSGQSLGNEKSWSGEQRAVEHPWLDSSTGWSAEEASSPAPLGLFMGAPSLVCLRSLSITSRA